jgi:hypothetical protein
MKGWKRFFAVGVLGAAAGAVAADPADWSASGGTLDSFSGYSAPPVLTPSFSFGLINPLISLDADKPLRVTFLGKEASNINQFWMNGSMVLSNLAVAPSEYGPLLTSPGTLSFEFRDTTDGDQVANGGALAEFASYAVLGYQGQGEFGAFTPWRGYSNEFDLVIGFNDGRTIDADYDDLVIGIAAIPEPSTYALMGVGLLAVSFLSRRRSGSKG